jgi:hypothetical protein
MAGIHNCTSRLCIFVCCPATSRSSCAIRHGTAFTSSLSAIGGGRPTDTSGDAVFLAVSSVVVGRCFSRRSFFTRFSSPVVRSKGSVRFAALRRTTTVQFMCGSLLPLLTISVGMGVPSLPSAGVQNSAVYVPTSSSDRLYFPSAASWVLAKLERPAVGNKDADDSRFKVAWETVRPQTVLKNNSGLAS